MYVAETQSDALTWVDNCSRRLGKSFRLCLRATEVCRQVPNAQARIIAPTQKQMRNILLPLIRTICKDSPEEIKPVWKQMDSLWYFPGTDSELHVAGSNNGHEDDSRGTASHWIGIEEAGYIDNLEYLVQDVLMPQLLTTRLDTNNRFGKLVMVSTPPPTPSHPYVDMAEVARAKGNYSEYTIHDSGYPAWLIEKFCEAAGGADSTTWMREYLCQFVIDKNLALVPEWSDTYVVEWPRSDFFRFYHLYNGMDLGVSDFTVCLFGYYDFRAGRLVIEDELVMNGPQMTTPLLGDAIKAKRVALWPKVQADGTLISRDVYRAVSDNDNPLLLNDLATLHGINFQPVVKDSLNAMVNAMRILIGSGRLVVHPRCKQLVGCLRTGVWENEKRKAWFNSGPGKFGHFDALAALMYLIRNLDMQTNPIPPLLNIDESTHFINPDAAQQESQKIEAVKRLAGLGRGE